MTIRTRFAPSPTGYLHIGGVRTALFSWLQARKMGGEFILRIEDTDRERSTLDAIDAILEGMAWMGLDYDEGPYYQTQHYDRYQEVIDRLLADGNAYRCYCSREELEAMREAAMQRGEKPRYDGRCRERTDTPAGIKPVIRFRSPMEGTTVVNDLIQGKVAYSNSELDDLIIARSDGTPTYNLTVVVDDMDMRITDVIRGDDHLNNTPRQMNIMQALDHHPPRYAHVPLILGPDGKRLSKRHGATNVLQYRDDGYLPQAMLNYLVRLGWAHGDQEIFSLDEMVHKFDISDVNKSAARFDTEKLNWLNQHYMKTLPPEKLVPAVKRHLGTIGLDPDNGPDLIRLIEVQRERCETLQSLAESSRVFFEDFDDYDPKSVEKHMNADSLPVLEHLHQVLAETEWNRETLHGAIKTAAETLELKMGKVAQPLRVALCGTAISPSIDATLELMGRDRTLARIASAINYIRSMT
ncbi:MAG: glutamate--tRNA ligase [Gammaproteobacteria bacterium]|nr:glutamate--tRNA ligase [Gammaproteobacteria bacterium]